MPLFGSSDATNGRQQLQERQHEQQAHQQMTNAMLNQSGQMSLEYLEGLVEHDVDVAKVEKLRTMLSDDFVLANLENAEVTEAKWLARILIKKLEAIHPPEESIYQGEFRAVCMDDPTENIKPLTPMEKYYLQKTIMAVHARVSRSRDGWQQDQTSKQITASYMRSDENESKGRLGGLFG